MICDICKKYIVKNNNVVILSYPVKIIDNDSNYSLEEFYKHEKIIHLACYNNPPSSSVKKEDAFAGEDEIFMKYLQSLGDSPSKKKVREFLNKNSGSLEKLIKKWFS